MMLPLSIVGLLEAELTAITGVATTIAMSQSLSGGNLRQVVKITYNHTDFVVKWHQNPPFAGMFQAEATGLNLMAQTNTVFTPKHLQFGQKNGVEFLLMEHIPTSTPNATFWETLGTSLAEMHHQSNESFGLDDDNFIGDLPQKNTLCTSWADFFVHQRLAPLLQQIIEKKMIDTQTQSAFFALFDRMDQLFPREAPSLLHGDLWNGNVICNAKQQAVLIDPAVYYGHREMDIAMTLLFGGFHPSFYTAYQARFPLAEGWQKRSTLCNLYPLMVHLLLFGRSYLPQLLQHLQQLKTTI